MNELIKFYQEDSPTSHPQFWEGKCWDWFEKTQNNLIRRRMPTPPKI
jgi:hypothetical protein